jgi:hypothetical protein
MSRSPRDRKSEKSCASARPCERAARCPGVANGKARNLMRNHRRRRASPWHRSCLLALAMRRISQVVVFFAFVCAGARFASAVCGDGILDGGEQCDGGAPASQTACPGRCAPLPLLDACKCTGVSSDPADFAAIADLQARLAPHSSVLSGGVAVVTAAACSRSHPAPASIPTRRPLPIGASSCRAARSGASSAMTI